MGDLHGNLHVWCNGGGDDDAEFATVTLLTLFDNFKFRAYRESGPAVQNEYCIAMFTRVH